MANPQHGQQGVLEFDGGLGYLARISSRLLRRFVWSLRGVAGYHRLASEWQFQEGATDPEGHSPSALVGKAQGLLKLPGADSLAAGADEGESAEPLGERDVATFKEGPRTDGELLATGFTFPDAMADGVFGLGLWGERVGALICAMRTDRTAGPTQ